MRTLDRRTGECASAVRTKTTGAPRGTRRRQEARSRPTLSRFATDAGCASPPSPPRPGVGPAVLREVRRQGGDMDAAAAGGDRDGDRDLMSWPRPNGRRVGARPRSVRRTPTRRSLASVRRRRPRRRRAARRRRSEGGPRIEGSGDRQALLARRRGQGARAALVHGAGGGSSGSGVGGVNQRRALDSASNGGDGGRRRRRRRSARAARRARRPQALGRLGRPDRQERRRSRVRSGPPLSCRTWSRSANARRAQGPSFSWARARGTPAS
jgi:hypothetical protein